ncbi:HlyD family secretion protein [Oleomonas cavernae]|uniref:HlyD family secretion protein n=1 Tax=Oleomonas cavernae TaxID=2320859 RepID=A0A418WGI1_9PROT|nr:HlyD family secretion protein [Oleomonas cavernae]RJF89088.1 HlyD family secretion protein [Oleomonas cavernae]
MKPQVKFGLLGLLVVAVVAFAGWLYLTRHLISTDDAYIHADIAPISTKVEGTVATVLVTDNQMVRAGDILLRIDDATYKAQADGARASVAAAAADVETLTQQVAQQESRIAAARADIDSATAEAERSARDLARQTKLATSDFATRQNLETARADAAKASAALSRAQASLAIEQAERTVLQAKLVESRAALDQAKAQLALADQNLADTVIRAPVAGVVGNRGVVTGQYVRPGVIMLSLVPIEDLWIEANFKETQLAAMGAGQPVEISVDAFPGVSLRGRVESFSPASGALFSLLPPENASGNFTKVVQRLPVKILIDKDQADAARLVPGLSVVVTVDTSVAPAPLAYVPAPAPAAMAGQ